jgi:hypothetical protein
MKAKQLLYTIGLLLILFGVIACQDTSPADNDTDPAPAIQTQPPGSSGLLHHADTDEVDMTDREAMIGILVLHDGCVRLNVPDLDDPSGAFTSYLTFWPPGFTMQFAGEEVLLLNQHARAVGRLAEILWVDGSPSDSLSPALEDQRPSACPGPYIYIYTASNHIPQ